MRRDLRLPRLLGAVLAVFVLSAAAAADDPPARARKDFTIFMVLWRGETKVEEGFRKYLTERNMPAKIVVRNIDRDLAKIPAVRREIADMKPDLVYAWGTPITLALVGEYDSKDPVRYVTTIPVVFVMVTYPVGSRIVQSMDGSQRNVTGATPTVPLESQIKAMQAYRPLRRLAVIYNGLEPNSVFNVRELKKLSAQMDFELVERRVPLDASGRPDASAIPQMVADLAVREPQFLYFGPDSFVGEHRDRIAEEAMRFGVPAFTATEFELMEGKALVGLIARYTSLGALAGYMAERILVHDVLPRDIPIQRLTRFTYGVRMSVARRLGIFPPMNVLDFAEIIDERGK